MIPIGDQIYLRRLEEKLTQQELAKKAGIPQPNLSNIEKGRQDLTISTLRKIALALSIHPSEFFSETVPASGKTNFSRAQIEKIARGVTGREKLNPNEQEIAALLKKIIPQKGRIRLRELNNAWLELRRKFNQQEINSLYERVMEQQRRNL